MKYLKQFNIQFVGLKEGSHLFNYTIDNKFFEAFNYDDTGEKYSSLKIAYNNSKNKTESKRHLEVKSMDSYETIVKDMGEYYIDEGSNTSIYS